MNTAVKTDKDTTAIRAGADIVIRCYGAMLMAGPAAAKRARNRATNNWHLMTGKNL